MRGGYLSSPMVAAMTLLGVSATAFTTASIASGDRPGLSVTLAIVATLAAQTGFGRLRREPDASRVALGVVETRHDGTAHALRQRVATLEVRLRAAESDGRRTAAVFDAIDDGVLVTDADGGIVVVNRAARTLLNLPPDGPARGPIDRILADTRLNRLIGDARDTAATGECRRLRWEAAPREATAGPRLCEARSRCLVDAAGDTVAICTLVRDRTRESHAAEAGSEFVSRASHELRTPLSSIRAYAEMLLDGEPGGPEARQRFCEIIHAESERLTRLVDNLLSLGQLDAGVTPIEDDLVDVKALVDRAVATIRPIADEKRISIATRLPGFGVHVRGDADLLQQVVVNLVSNAVKYTPREGRVLIEAHEDARRGGVSVSVSDTGTGIPPEALPRVFDKFYRVEHSRRTTSGSGLGLSLCKEIVEKLHGGRIDVESRIGAGSTFRFSIPTRPTRPSRPPLRAAA